MAASSSSSSSIKTVIKHENIYTLPNLLTFSRLAATPLLGWLVVTERHGLAVCLLGYAAFSDLLDGWIARRWKLGTVVGSVIDPMADKALVTVLTVALAVRGTLPCMYMPTASTCAVMAVVICSSVLRYPSRLRVHVLSRRVERGPGSGRAPAVTHHLLACDVYSGADP